MISTPCQTRAAVTRSVVEISAAAGQTFFRLPAAVVRRRLLAGHFDARAMVRPEPGADPVPVGAVRHLVPWADMADAIVEGYRCLTDASAAYFDRAGHFLELAGEKPVPGLELVLLVCYFATRSVCHDEAFGFLIKALALDSGAAMRSLVLNDLGVLMLKFGRVPEAVVLFGASVRCGQDRTEAGIENLRLLQRMAARLRVELPGLAEVMPFVDEAERRRDGDRKRARSRGSARSSTPRPHPETDDWGFYLAESDIPGAMLRSADGAERALAASRALIDAERVGDALQAAALRSRAATELVAVTPLARLEQQRQAAVLDAEMRGRVDDRFVELGGGVKRSLGVGDLAGAEKDLGTMRVLADTEVQRDHVEHLAKLIAHRRAELHDGGYELTSPETASVSAQEHEGTGLSGIREGIATALSAADFESALRLAASLTAFDTVPRELVDQEEQRIRGLAARDLRDRLIAHLRASPPRFADAEAAIRRAEVVSLPPATLDELRALVVAARQGDHERRVFAMAADGRFDEAVELMMEAPGPVSARLARALADIRVRDDESTRHAGDRRQAFDAAADAGSFDLLEPIVAFKLLGADQGSAWRCYLVGYEAVKAGHWHDAARACGVLHRHHGDGQPVAGLACACLIGIENSSGRRGRLLETLDLLPAVPALVQRIELSRSRLAHRSSWTRLLSWFRRSN